MISEPLTASCLTDNVSLTLKANAVVHFTISAYQPVPEYGYDYEWYQTHC